MTRILYHIGSDGINRRATVGELAGALVIRGLDERIAATRQTLERAAGK